MPGMNGTVTIIKSAGIKSSDFSMATEIKSLADLLLVPQVGVRVAASYQRYRPDSDHSHQMRLVPVMSHKSLTGHLSGTSTDFFLGSPPLEQADVPPASCH